MAKKLKKGWIKKAKRKWVSKRLYSWEINDDGQSLGTSGVKFEGGVGQLYRGWNWDEYAQFLRLIFEAGFIDGFWLARHIAFTHGVVEPCANSSNFIHGKPFWVAYTKLVAHI